MYVYLLATLDTKGAEAKLLKEFLQQLGHAVKVIDTGSMSQPGFQPDITRQEVFGAAGLSLAEIQQRSDRGFAVDSAAKGAATIVNQFFDQGEVAGVISLGGSAGTTIGTAAMRALPVGIPKVMLSTLASGRVRRFVGNKDIAMINSIVDISGINRLSRVIIRQAAAAMSGMVNSYLESLENTFDANLDRPMIAATMFGVTTLCVQHARQILEKEGYEVVVFHATGNGGQAMEDLISEELFDGVLDLTTTEIADELVGGEMSAGPERLKGPGKFGIPHVVSVGATDMVNFGHLSSVPEQFQDRKIHSHNSNVTLMRTSADENRRIGEIIGTRISNAPKPNCEILFPNRGVSALDAEGMAFDDPEARAILKSSIQQSASNVNFVESEYHINDPEFAALAAKMLIDLISRS